MARVQFPTLSIIVPILNESARLEDFLRTLLERMPEGSEVILVDGGSTDGSAAIAEPYPVKLIFSTKGRALQMNAGARSARGKYLMFLHADTEVQKHFASEIIWWASTDPVWGFSPVRLTGSEWWCRLIESGINLRTAVTAGASGDQALIVKANYFRKLGGFPEIELMEDIAMSYRLRRSWSARRFRRPVVTSSRRWQRNGALKTVLLMWFLRSSYRIGVSPKRLASWYSRA